MATKFTIGAPSITGIDANDQVNEFFSDAKFPLTIRLTNLFSRPISLPEADVFLKAVGHKDSKAEAKIKTLDDFHRLASSIEQIAELNTQEEAIIVEDLTPAKAESTKPAKAPTPAPVQTAEAVVGG
jgi:hypothetical protein